MTNGRLPASGKYLMDNVQCNGDEESIGTCSWRDKHDCSAREVAGVRCWDREYFTYLLVHRYNLHVTIGNHIVATQIQTISHTG